MTAQADTLLKTFWKSLGEVRTGMLGLVGDDGRAQPMTAHFEGHDGPIWFYARADSALVDASGAEAPAAFYYAAGGHELFAWVQGDLAVETDPGVAERFWSEEIAKWFPQGANDPDLRILRFTPAQAHLWRPNDGPEPSRFGFGAPRAQDIRASVQL